MAYKSNEYVGSDEDDQDINSRNHQNTTTKRQVKAPSS